MEALDFKSSTRNRQVPPRKTTHGITPDVQVPINVRSLQIGGIGRIERLGFCFLGCGDGNVDVLNTMMKNLWNALRLKLW